MATETGTVVSADGTTITVDRTGSGPAVVLVVGAFCDRLSTAGLVPLLAAEFTVYSYDRRGRGDSGDTHPYAVRREVEDLAAVITAAGGTARLYGHSSGAVLALEAATAGLPISKLAAYEPPYSADGGEPMAEGLAEGLAERLWELAGDGRRAEAAELFLQTTGMPPEVIGTIRRSADWPGMQAIAHTLGNDVTLCGDGRFPAERMAGIAVPVLVMAGGTSYPWAAQVAERIATTVAGGRARTVDGQGHGVAHDVIAPILLRFFR